MEYYFMITHLTGLYIYLLTCFLSVECTLYNMIDFLYLVWFAEVFLTKKLKSAVLRNNMNQKFLANFTNNYKVTASNTLDLLWNSRRKTEI